MKLPLGTSDGNVVADGPRDGIIDGRSDGSFESVGDTEGNSVGTSVGLDEGYFVSWAEIKFMERSSPTTKIENEKFRMIVFNFSSGHNDAVRDSPSV